MAARKVRILVVDRDLLDIPAAARRKFRFQIVTPREFLALVEKDT